jgi:hypothetical protein
MPRTPLGLAVLALSLNLGPGPVAAQAASPCTQALGSAAATTLEGQARLEFRQGHYAAAYGRYVRLADAGHVPSAELALLMLRNGPQLFGSAWTASEKQQTCWNALMIARARQWVAADDSPASD